MKIIPDKQCLWVTCDGKKIPAIIAMSPERGQTQTNDHDRLKGPSGPDISIFRATLAGGENHIFFYSICIVAKRDARFFRDSLKNIGIEKSIKLIAPSGCYPGYWGDFRVVFFCRHSMTHENCVCFSVLTCSLSGVRSWMTKLAVFASFWMLPLFEQEILIVVCNLACNLTRVSFTCEVKQYRYVFYGQVVCYKVRWWLNFWNVWWIVLSVANSKHIEREQIVSCLFLDPLARNVCNWQGNSLEKWLIETILTYCAAFLVQVGSCMKLHLLELSSVLYTSLNQEFNFAAQFSSNLHCSTSAIGNTFLRARLLNMMVRFRKLVSTRLQGIGNGSIAIQFARTGLKISKSA